MDADNNSSSPAATIEPIASTEHSTATAAAPAPADASTPGAAHSDVRAERFAERAKKASALRSLLASNINPPPPDSHLVSAILRDFSVSAIERIVEYAHSAPENTTKLTAAARTVYLPKSPPSFAKGSNVDVHVRLRADYAKKQLALLHILGVDAPAVPAVIEDLLAHKPSPPAQPPVRSHQAQASTQPFSWRMRSLSQPLHPAAASALPHSAAATAPAAVSPPPFSWHARSAQQLPPSAAAAAPAATDMGQLANLLKQQGDMLEQQGALLAKQGAVLEQQSAMLQQQSDLIIRLCTSLGVPPALPLVLPQPQPGAAASPPPPAAPLQLPPVADSPRVASSQPSPDPSSSRSIAAASAPPPAAALLPPRMATSLQPTAVAVSPPCSPSSSEGMVLEEATVPDATTSSTSTSAATLSFPSGAGDGIWTQAKTPKSRPGAKAEADVLKSKRLATARAASDDLDKAKRAALQSGRRTVPVAETPSPSDSTLSTPHASPPPSRPVSPSHPGLASSL
jgi:hypothetical protein